MTTERASSGTGPPPPGDSPAAPPSDRDAEERADIAEDRRRQRDLDDGELGGEA